MTYPVLLKPQYLRHSATPRLDNGEYQLALALVRLRLGFNYEAFRYELEGGVVFVPDFNLRGTRRRPAINLELTWADWAMDRFGYYRALRALELKRWKARQTLRLYGVHTVIVTYADWQLIIAKPRHLSWMIDQELHRDEPARAA
jgi:hypothetical protein